MADTRNDTIRKITPDGVVTTMAGTAAAVGSADGTGAAARFNTPEGVATDGAGNVYVADTTNDTIRKITPDGVVTTMAGIAAAVGSADGTGAAARFYFVEGLATDGAGNLYVADDGNDIIRKVTPAGVVTTLAGVAGMQGSTDGTGAEARFSGPTGVALDGAGDVYVADNSNGLDTRINTIRKITPDGVVTTFAGTAGTIGTTDGTGAAARFAGPTGVALGDAGNVYVSDAFSDPDIGAFGSTIRKITTAGVVTTFAGMAGTNGSTDGTGAAARFNFPQGVATDGACNLYVADAGNDIIRKITPAGVTTTLAGAAGMSGSTDGVGAAARFYFPRGVATDGAGNVYVADTGNDTIRKITPDGVVTTIVGRPGEQGFLPGPLPGLLNAPTSVAVFGRTLYTTTNNAIVQVSNVP